MNIHLKKIIMKLQLQIANSIKNLYDFHDYQIAKENLLRLTKSVIEIKPDISAQNFDKFIKSVGLGEYGVLYRMPTCLLSMFQKYKVEPGNSVYRPSNEVTESSK